MWVWSALSLWGLPLTEAALRPINPRHNHCPHSCLFWPLQPENEGGLLLLFTMGPLVLVVWPLNLWWAVCSSVRSSVCVCLHVCVHACSVCWGLGCQGKLSLCWSKKAFNIDSFTHPAQGKHRGQMSEMWLEGWWVEVWVSIKIKLRGAIF